jgi:integrase
MSKPKFETFTTPGGKERVLLTWYFHGDLIRKRFDNRNHATGFITATRQEAKDLHQNLLLASETEQADLVVGLEIAREHGFTVSEACRAYADRPDAVERIEMAKAINLFLASRRAKNLRTKTISSYHEALSMFRIKTNDKSPCDIDRSDLDTFFANPDWKPPSRNHYIRHVGAFFRWCEGRYVTGDPFKRIEMSVEDRGKPEIFTVAQTRKLMKAAQDTDRSMVAYLALGFFAGIRPEAIPAMNWDDIDLETKQITVREEVSKTRHDFHVAIEENLAAWLESVRDLPLTPPGVRNRRRSLQEESGVSWITDGMRHSFGSYHLDAHQDPKQTSWEMGHKGRTDMLFKHYRRLVRKGDGKKFFTISP